MSFCHQIRQIRQNNTYLKHFFFKHLEAIPSHLKAKWCTDPLSPCKKINSQKYGTTFCYYNTLFDSTSYKIRCKVDYLGSLQHIFQAAFQCLLNVSDVKFFHNFISDTWVLWIKSFSSVDYFISNVVAPSTSLSVIWPRSEFTQRNLWEKSATFFNEESSFVSAFLPVKKSLGSWIFIYFMVFKDAINISAKYISLFWGGMWIGIC